MVQVCVNAFEAFRVFSDVDKLIAYGYIQQYLYLLGPYDENRCYVFENR